MRNWFLAFLLILAVPISAIAVFDAMLAAPSDARRKQLVVIKPGSGVQAVAAQLEAQGLVKSASAFALWLRVRGQDRSLKAGIYAVAPAMGAKRIAEALVEGKGEAERVTVPEGFALSQIATVLDGRQAGSGANFLAAASDARTYAPEFPWLADLPAGASLEGFLFPDTYVAPPGAGFERELIRMMLARFQQVALPAFEGRPESHTLNLLETITMASIVEKEARHAVERPTIAGVFFNRLATRMPFGSDPTVEYVLKRHQGDRGLSFKDVAVDSPYNTYRYPGLPPGPIANPGLASLEASLRPAKTPYLYFVAKGDGTHSFTRTYAEHLASQRAIVAARKR